MRVAERVREREREREREKERERERERERPQVGPPTLGGSLGGKCTECPPLSVLPRIPATNKNSPKLTPVDSRGVLNTLAHGHLMAVHPSVSLVLLRS